MFQRKEYKEKQLRYSIRKVSFGAASVAISALYLLMGSAAVSASEVQAVNGDQTSVANPAAKDNEDKSRIEKHETTTEAANSMVVTLDKTALSKLIEEIDGKFTNGKYASKTEDSVNKLKTALEEARTALSNAKTQAELTQAHANLIVATTKLQTKPKEKKQPPAGDTTNGKPTVGFKATNTEKSSDSNSIANSGARDKRHGKALDRSKPFRTDADPANTDTAANQTYTAPAENADLKTLATTLINLDATVENNTKLSKTMDEIGNSKNIPKGTVMEITEFGGWKAVDGGVFAIARRTEEGVYPLETINSTLDDTVWLREQAFDRDTEYTLLLSKTRTRANRNEATADGSAYKPKYEGLYVAKNVARYKGIEKIFKAYSTKEGSDVIIKFKPGYVGDMDGTKANYKVEVYSITGDQETKVYETTFDPSKSVNNDKMIVTPATDGTNKEKIRISNASIALPDGDDTNVQRTGFIGKREAEKLMARPENLPNGKAGTFTSKPIALPQGADHYKVRISLADQNRTGMSYQAWDEKYSIPVTGADFSIAQDTSRVAKSLLQRVYDKLLATVDADKRGKTLETQAAYQAQLDAIKALLDGELKSTDDYKRLVQPTLEAHKELKVDKSALTTSTGKLEQLVDDDPTRDKTPETVKVYNDALNAAKAEVNKANTVIADDSATVDQVAQAVADVRAKRAELRAARALLVVAATTEQKTKLQNDSDALKEADKTNKTPNSITEYNAKYKELEAALTAAKAQAKAVLDKTVNAGKEEATDAQIEVDKIKAELDKAAALLKDKGNTAELEKAKNALSDYITQQTNDNVTAGKTKDSQDAYAIAKTAADKAVEDAAAVIASENSTVEDVANALADIKVKKAELEAAKKNLVPAATDAQKAKLEADAAKLVKADITGKTQDSINAYETTYNNLTAELEAAKAKAIAVKAAGDNASEYAVLKAQEAVDAVQAKLDVAKATLVDKATEEQVAELRKAEAALTPAEESTLAGTKTPASIAAYKNAVDAIQTQLTEAKAKAADLVTKAGQNNATKAEAVAAIAKVEELKVELAKANALLKDKANTSDLATAKEALKELAKVENVTDGKTTSTTEAYEAAKREADAAVTAAEGIINNADSTPEQVAEALTNVKAKKAALEAAKAALVDKATDAQKTKLEESAAKLVKADTAGKTQESINEYETTYNNLKTELDKAIEAAAAIKTAGDNASEHAALKAQEAVDAVQAKLDAAKATLVDKATEEQVAELRKAEAALTPAEESTLAGTKTPASIAAYKKAVDAIQSQLTEAKATAAALVIKAEQNNAKKVDAAEAIAKVDALKVELAKANALLKDKANTGDLAAAKEELKALAGVANVTDGKTTSTKDAYDAAKREADTAVTAAEGIINNADSSPEEVATALTNVKAKKAELEKAKTALLDKITQDQKDDLANAEEKLKLADTTGKTAESIKAYNDEVAKLSDDLAAAKQVAKDLLDKGDNAGELEAYRVQAKINKLKSKLAEAAKLLKDIDKSAAKKEVEDAAKKATDAIVANNDLTPDQKEAAKVKVAEEANKAIAAIEKATTEDDVTTATDAGKLGIEKEAAKAEIEATKAAKEKAIEANTDLTPEQKAAAKAKVAEEATKATAAIDQATTKEAVKTATDTGKLGIEKEAEKAEIEAEKAAKEKAIDARTDLTDDEKAKVKAKVAEEAKKAIEAIENAKTHNDASAKTETGKDDIKKINPVGAKEEAKKAVEEALTNKEKEIDARTDLTLEGKNKEKALAREEAEAAKKAIEQATNIGEIEKALRPFLYQIDQDALVLDRPAFNIEAYIKVSVTGIVIAKRGNAITQADIIAKLNISENVTVNSIELPDTTTVGRKSAKVTLILADGTEAVVFVPVEVVESSEENHQQNNTQVKPQEDEKPAVVLSDNSEQPAVNQTEDVKENPSNASQETKGSKQTVLPNTGTGSEISIFGSAAMTVLASLGLVATSKRKEEE